MRIPVRIWAALSRRRAIRQLAGLITLEDPSSNLGDAIFNPRRCVANNTEQKGYPAHTELSSKTCRECGKGIKLKHLQRAKDCGHQPPVFCYDCLCVKKNKKPTRLRKLELAKQRQAERERLAKGIAPP